MKNKKGISLIILVVTITVMLILASTVITVGLGNLNTKKLTSMYTDLKSINDHIYVYYDQYGTLPLKEKFMGAYNFSETANPNDDQEGYYVIDINKLDKLILTQNLDWEENEVYIINTKTHTVYYPAGVKLDGEKYYRLPGEYSKLETLVIEILVNPEAITSLDVMVTIKWPTYASAMQKLVSIDGGKTWKEYTGDIGLTKNCEVVAKVVDNKGKTVEEKRVEIANIDKNEAIVTAKEEKVYVKEGKDVSLDTYFSIEQNGIAKIESVVFTDETGTQVTNVKELLPGLHTITCTVTKENATVETATVIVEVLETGVYGNLYKKGNEYHLIFNTDGEIAEGYAEAELVVRGSNIKESSYTVYDEENDIWKSPYTWEPYSANITKVKIEELIKPQSTRCYFMGLSKITEIEGFYNIYTSDITSMGDMFNGCSSLTSLDVSNWDTSNVGSMNSMFYGCSSLASLDVSNWNTSKVSNMGSMFNGCSSLTSLDVSDFDTSNVTMMYHMFANCEQVTKLEVNGFDITNVTNIGSMFSGCSGLTSLDVSSWNTR